MKRLLIALAALLACAPAFAQQKPTDQIKSDISTLLPTTGTGSITAVQLRQVVNEIADSYANKAGDTFAGSVTVPTLTVTGSASLPLLAITGALGFTPANKAGDTFTGPVTIPFTQSGTGSAARTVDGKLKDIASVLDFGAKCDGSTDDTTAIQAAITAAQARGGWMLTFPAATCNISGTLTVSGSHIHLFGSGRGATTLAFTGAGTADAIQIGTFPNEANCVGVSQPGTCLQTGDNSIRNMSVTASSRTGGWLFNVYGQSGLLLEDIAFNGWDLIQSQFFNTLILNRVVGYTNDTTNQSISLFQKITTGTTNGWFRSDVASFNDVVVNNNSHGGSCVNIDGMINTVRFARTALLNCAYGLSVSNSQASTSFYPAFLMTEDLEIDGSSKTAININAGREFHFAGCDINAKSATSTSYFAVAVGPDLSGSVTSGVYFTGCSVHTAPGAVAFFNAKHVSIDGSNFYDSNKNVTTGTSPVIQINGGDGFIFVGGLIGQRFGDSKAPSFGVQIDNGVGAVSVVGVNLKGALTKSISNASANAISFLGGITYAGAANTLTTCATGTTC